MDAWWQCAAVLEPDLPGAHKIHQKCRATHKLDGNDESILHIQKLVCGSGSDVVRCGGIWPQVRHEDVQRLVSVEHAFGDFGAPCGHKWVLSGVVGYVGCL
ncbi:MAG: hypothetical protein HC767_11445 [Akkermansiaceae bacterium]|nr:hypothetical protein [Akkermansiaceae bacterium]